MIARMHMALLNGTLIVENFIFFKTPLSNGGESARRCGSGARSDGNDVLTKSVFGTSS